MNYQKLINSLCTSLEIPRIKVKEIPVMDHCLGEFNEKTFTITYDENTDLATILHEFAHYLIATKNYVVEEEICDWVATALEQDIPENFPLAQKIIEEGEKIEDEIGEEQGKEITKQCQRYDP